MGESEGVEPSAPMLRAQIRELEARVAALEALLKSIRGYMVPGYVMPVREQAKHIVQWIDSALNPGGEHGG